MPDLAATNSWISRRSDLVLAVFVVMIIAMMIIRMPARAMDFLIAINITVSATLLLVSLYIPSAIKLASFPTLLLLTTLFRLAINVSSTRLILLDGYAGEIIFAFGNFVVSGNYVVGGIV